MRRTCRPVIGTAALVLILLIPLPRTVAGEPAASLGDVQWRTEGDATLFTVPLSRPVRYRTLTPARNLIAVDLWAAQVDAERLMTIPKGIAWQFEVRRLTPEIVRFSISTREDARFKVYTAADRITVSVFPDWLSTVPVPRSVAYGSLRVPTGAGRAQVHVVTLDPRGQAISVQPALGGGVVAATERTSRAATRLEAVAAINGNFYSYAGLPIGLVVIDGRVLSSPFPRRAVFGIDGRGLPWIGAVEFSARLVADPAISIPISAINRPPRSGGLALYTPEFGPLTFPQALVATVRQDRVAGFASGRLAIPRDGYALAATDSHAGHLRALVPGQPVQVEVKLAPPGIRHAVQGGPQLVRNGEVFVPYDWEGFSAAFARMRTARSAIGITKAGKVLLVAVDRPDRGRTGMSLFELARTMRDLGAVHAMNLDGGGSTTLVVGGRVVTALPRGGERTVSSVLVALPAADGTP